MKKITILFVVLCLGVLGFLYFSPLSKIHEFRKDILEEQVRVIEMELYPLMQDPQSNQGGIEALKKELFWFDLEIKRQTWFVDYILYVFVMLATAILAVGWLASSKKLRLYSGIKELTPTEKYVDEYTYERMVLGGFRNKEEAKEWISNDQLRKCEYCGARNFPTPDSNPDQIQFCTFYKQVPDQAKDLRIVLGSIWNVVPARKLACSGCGKIVKRG